MRITPLRTYYTLRYEFLAGLAEDVLAGGYTYASNPSSIEFMVVNSWATL